jgi:ATP-dependent helicase HrpB
VSLLTQLHCEPGNWPDVSDDGLLVQLDTWLSPYLAGVNSLQDIKRLDLSRILSALLDWPQQQALNTLAPESFTVPSGSVKKIDYCQSPPVLAVKLQEMFGCQDTPRVANGKQPLTVHLLSPARRPLQVTQDLAGFWRGSYQDVKREMKGRYPKHPWPDDPTTAVATARLKPKPSQK